MDKKYKHQEVEQKIYKMWEDGKYFEAKIDPKKKPYTIVLPPPNASGKMHIGNVLMIAIEDLLIRHKRMQGYSALWVPGTDHAGFETQITFERKLAEQGKSRFDYDRQTLYTKIWHFVQKNKGQIEEQIKQMGASVDWSRYTFTLDDKVINTVLTTFKKMHSENLVYRDDYMVNYCPGCGTTFADLEIEHKEQKTPLYYIKYKLVEPVDGQDHIVVATTRPEPIFIDTHLAVNPKDKSKKNLIGKKVINPLNDLEMEIIGDSFVDPEFGTGIVKLTPGHDKNDYAVAKEHDLPIVDMLTLDGRINDTALAHNRVSHLSGLTVIEARDEVVKILKELDAIENIDYKYKNSVAVCYKGGHVIEPKVLPNWFIKVDSLKKPALDVVQKGNIKIFPKWQKITYTRWMEQMHDWPISRQVVWGIRVPAWYDVNKNPNIFVTFLDKNGENVVGRLGEILKGGTYSFKEIESGLQTLIAPKNSEFVIQKERPEGEFLQETDTFDTWFSSGHWPLVTLGYPDSEDFKYFYPTAVLETGWEIIRLWVSRMIMFGIYLTGQAPFSYVYLHGLVKAIDGKKMSKSLGNNINPEEYLEKYGADALRMGLITGTATGKDFAFPHDKVLSYRNFANKVWNMARFMLMMTERFEDESDKKVLDFEKDNVVKMLKDEDKKIIEGLNTLIKSTNSDLDKYRFAQAAETIYHYMWDDLASNYIEHVKDREDKEVALAVLRYVFSQSLKILHPFMPFITEEVWSNITSESHEPLIISKWPSAIKNA